MSAVSHTGPSELDFQRAYARFLTDSAFRQSVLLREPVSSQQDEEPDIAERLRGMNAERVCMFADLLVGNRISTIQEGVPFTAAALGADLPTIVGRYSDTVPCADHRKYPEACAFAHYLLEQMESEVVGPAYLRDLVTYELARLQLRFEYSEPLWRDETMMPGIEAISALRSGRTVCVHRHAYQALLSFSYDMEELCRQLEASQAQADPEPKASLVLLHIGTGGALHELAINASTAALLLAVNGRRTFEEIVDELAELLDRKGEEPRQVLRDDVLRLCAELIEQGVIGCTRVDNVLKF